MSKNRRRKWTRKFQLEVQSTSEDDYHDAVDRPPLSLGYTERPDGTKSWKAEAGTVRGAIILALTVVVLIAVISRQDPAPSPTTELGPTTTFTTTTSLPATTTTTATSNTTRRPSTTATEPKPTTTASSTSTTSATEPLGPSSTQTPTSEPRVLVANLSRSGVEEPEPSPPLAQPDSPSSSSVFLAERNSISDPAANWVDAGQFSVDGESYTWGQLTDFCANDQTITFTYDRLESDHNLHGRLALTDPTPGSVSMVVEFLLDGEPIPIVLDGAPTTRPELVVSVDDSFDFDMSLADAKTFGLRVQGVSTDHCNEAGQGLVLLDAVVVSSME